MKKFLNHATILIVATLFTFNACLSDNPYNPIVVEDEVTSVLLSLNQDTEFETRGTIEDNQLPARIQLNTGDLYLVTSNGTIVEHFRIIEGGTLTNTVTEIPATAHTIYRNNLAGGGVRITNVPVSMRGGRVYIVGNPRVNNPTTGNISTVLNQPVIDMRHQRSRNNTQGAHLIGSTHLVLAPEFPHETWAPPFYVCECDPIHPWCYNLQINLDKTNPVTDRRVLRLSPVAARISFRDILAVGQIGYFTVEGIFIDNYYRRATVGGIPVNDATSLRENILNNRPFNNQNLSGYPAVFHGHTFQWYDSGMLSNRPVTNNVNITRPDGTTHSVPNRVARPYSVIPALPTAWAFYVLAEPRPGRSRTPHIILRLRDVIRLDGDGTPSPGPYYVTFHEFVWAYSGLIGRPPDGGTFPGIRAADHYRVPLLIFSEHDLSPFPNLDLQTLSTRAVPIMIE